MLNLISGFWALGLISILSLLDPVPKTVYKASSGNIVFISEAPLETITAKSGQLKGAIDTTNNTFAFSVSINSFKGFNSPLQQQHFYENYMESTAYPVATFSGKIIELINYSKPGLYEVRAKGILNVHGVNSERIIRSTLEIKNDVILVKSNFLIPLQDHNIKIPRIVFQKIAPEILVEMDAVLKPVLI